MSPDDNTPPLEDPTPPPADPPPADPPPADPPTPPPADPPTPPPADDPDRLGALETMVSNLAEIVAGITESLTKSSDDAKPTKLPWTAWGSKRESEER